MELKPGYKLTEIGVIPEEWEVKKLGELGVWKGGATPSMARADYWINGTIPWASSGDIKVKRLSSTGYGINELAVRESSTTLVPKSSILIVTRSGILRKYLPVALTEIPVAINQDIKALIPSTQVVSEYALQVISGLGPDILSRCMKAGTTVESIELSWLMRYTIPLPPLAEQQAIAAALSDVDALIDALDRQIAKQRAVKQGAMQELLTGQRRLPGFSGAWEIGQLQDLTDCQDQLRVPLNESQRLEMGGIYPYCGANGVLDFINDFLIDDDIILLAEDGGYFDEYATRPIAYQMRGKCWVNNHAHILKAKDGVCQDFIFYQLVHKDVRRFLANGTRAKLNKAQMHLIEIAVPPSESEQQTIAAVLSDMDAEIAALEAQRDKTRQLKQGMMQELLTGRTRLIGEGHG